MLSINLNSYAQSINAVKLYPNPVVKGAPISLNIDHNEFGENIHLYITDVIGNIVFHEQVAQDDIFHTLFIESSPLSEGIYFIRISDTEDELTQKLIIQ